MKTTEEHTKYWSERKIDWVKSYLELWNHPHRNYLSYRCSLFPWQSMIEVGCASGPNLFHFIKRFPGRDIGGVDVSKDAIDVARQVLDIAKLSMPSRIAFAEVCSGDNIFIGDQCTDLVLTDMMLIYVDPFKIKGYLKEFKRIGRKKLVFYEFYSPRLWDRLKMMWRGYYAHNYPKLLKELGFDDIIINKLPPESWPESELHQRFGHIIECTI